MFGSVFTLIGIPQSPMSAERDKFKDIGYISLPAIDDGDVRVLGKDGQLEVRLGAAKHNGGVQVNGKREGAAVIDINEHGNSAEST